MKQRFEKLGYNMQQWMQGRYGNDELNIALYIVSLAFFLCSLFPRMRFFSIPAMLLMLWSCIRCYSKDITGRSRERTAWLRAAGSIKSWFRLQQDKWRDRKEYRYFRCKDCRAPLRVPRGKGNIRIRCPKCHSEIQAKT